MQLRNQMFNNIWTKNLSGCSILCMRYDPETFWFLILIYMTPWDYSKSEDQTEDNFLENYIFSS